jgi:amidophosphoribosyltransferase
MIKDIYQESQNLGKNMWCLKLSWSHQTHDFENTVFSFIPNTAEIAFYGMMKALEDHLNDGKKKILRLLL